MKKLIALALVLTLVVAMGWAALRPAQAQKPEVTAPSAPAPGLMDRIANGWRALFPGPTAELRVKVMDINTEQPIAGARCVLGETRQELWSQQDGWTPTVEAPIVRDPRLHRMLAQLAGQLTLICYKTGYRDTIFMGVRMHQGLVTEPEVWMIPIVPGDRRAEPWLYQMPIHRIWRVRLADAFRSKAEPGAGFERPER